MLVTEQGLTKSVDVDRLLARRVVLIDAIDKLVAASKVFGAYEIEFRKHSVREDTRGDMIAEADAMLWSELMNLSNLRTFMDAKRREEWDRKMYAQHKRREDIPEFTEETIAATFSTLYATRGEMMVDGIVEVFRSLSWDYKTNLPAKFGKRIITYVGEGFSSRANKLDDLDRFCHVLSKKPEPDHRDSMSAKYRAARGLSPKRVEIESDYLAARIFKNGNAHITFKSDVLRARFNQVIADRFPNCLPEGRCSS